MRNKLFLILSLFLLVSCQNSPTKEPYRQTSSVDKQQGVVSDVDDTIRISHAGGGFDNKRRVLFTKEVYVGMSELYNALMAKAESSNIHYISAAPGKLSPGSKVEVFFYGVLEKTIHGLMKKFSFPKKYSLDMPAEDFGKIKQRDEKIKKVTEYKVHAIESRIDPQLKYSLYGDDTEADFLAYAKIMQKYSHQIDGVYIHKVKGNVELENMLLYYTTLEPAIVEDSKGRISRSDVLVIAATLLDPNSDFEKVIPEFAVCPDAEKEKNWIVDLVSKSGVTDDAINQAAVKVQANILYFCDLRKRAVQFGG